MRPVVNKGIIARKMRTGGIEKISAIIPVSGVMIPPTPKANPIIRLDTMDFPRGANSCAMTTPSGSVARRRPPARKAGT